MNQTTKDAVPSLLPCPFCGGAVTLESSSDTHDRIYGTRKWWGVRCQNTINLGGTCAIEQRLIASKEAAVERWNRRAATTPEVAQAPYGYVYEWDTPFGVHRDFQYCTYNGSKPNRRVRVYAAPVAPTPAEQAEAVTISGLCARQYDWVERMGWHNKTVLEALALIASEVGEAVNECRGEAPTEAFGEELADILLRTFDLAQWQGIDLEAAILRKMAINEQRGTRGRRI